MYLTSDSGIRGIIDEILFFDNGYAAPLDYKYAEYKNKIFDTYRLQLVFYGRLIMDNFQLLVDKGYIVYTRSKNKIITLELTKKDFKKLDISIQETLKIIEQNYFPAPTQYKKRCQDCCYKNICEH